MPFFFILPLLQPMLSTDIHRAVENMKILKPAIYAGFGDFLLCISNLSRFSVDSFTFCPQVVITT